MGLVIAQPPASLASVFLRSWRAARETIGLLAAGSRGASRRYKRHVIKLASVISRYEQQRNSNAQVTEAIAESWAEKGEAHRSLVYGMTNTALRKVAKTPPPLESWSDIERADKAGRRACGLDDSEATRNISIGMQLINQRLEFITADLPKEID